MIITLNESEIQTLAAMRSQSRLDAANGIKSYFKIYETLANWLTTRYAVSAADPAVLWLRGATEANADRGSMAALIREYTQTQSQLRYGTRLSGPQMQAASDAVAEGMLADVLGEKASEWKRGDVPDITRIAVADATAVGGALFGADAGRDPLDTAFAANAAWSGTLLFSLLRSDQTGRLLATGTSGQLDTLNDLRDVLFAYLSYANGLKAGGEVFALNSLAVAGGDANASVNASLQLGRDLPLFVSTVVWAYFKGARDASALYDTVWRGASGTVGNTFKLITEVGVNTFLDMLIGAAVGEAQLGSTTDANFDSRARTFFNAYGTTAQTIGAELLPHDARSLVSLAQTDVNARAALAALSVVKVQVSPPFADKFSLFNTTTGQGEITDSWISNRAAMLEALLVRNRLNIPGVLTGAQGPAFAQGILYEDVSTNLVIRTGAVTDADRRVVWFGGTAADTRIGSVFADGLYGGAGDDSLFGLAGRDQLEGGAGADILDGGAEGDTLVGGAGNDVLTGGADNDTLMGGSDFDTYLFSTGFGHDTVVDSDGQGALKFDGTALTGGLKVSGLTGVWEDTLRQYVYTLVPTGSTGANDLVIGRRTAPGAATVQGTITVKNWQNGQLGINLDPTATLPTTPVVNTFTGGFIKKVGSDGVTYARNGMNYVSNGADPNAQDMLFGSANADRVAGGAGNDYLAGLAGDDLIEGEDGADLLVGGSGADRILGGAGDDHIFGSGNLYAAVAPERTNTPPPAAVGVEIARGFGWVVYNEPGLDANGLDANTVVGVADSVFVGAWPGPAASNDRNFVYKQRKIA